jgi:hypothetical protein
MSPQPAPDALPDAQDLAPALVDLERRLDPAQPEAAGGVRVLGHGEISVALTTGALPGLACKRMAGYADAASVRDYLALLAAYLDELTAAGIRVVPTRALPVQRPDRPPVVYLVQPLLDADALGNRLLHTADDAGLAAAIRAALDAVAGLARHSAGRGDGVEVALDGQLSNWWYGDPDHGPVLIDLGTPFLRRAGRHALDRELLLAPVPPGARAYYRRQGLVEAYLDDYFVPRTVALDLLGNLHKEGAPHRIAVALAAVNAWLADTPDLPGPRDPITPGEVDAYYRKDADLLALYLRVRRVDRFLRTKVLRRPYDFVLPGHVAR